MRKFLNSTNERKNMSTKTIYKRIALVAVAALGAGVLSVAPANAVVAIEDVVFATKSDLLNSSACTISNATGYGVKLGRFPSGSLVTLTRAVGTDATYISVSGPAIIEGATVANGGTAGATVTSTSITDGTAIVGDFYKIRLTGVGTVTVNYGSSSTATPVDYLTISSVASCSNDVFSAAFSDISVTNDGTDSTWTANVDEATSATAGTALHVRVDGDDAYNANITTGTWIANATNGAVVSFSSAIGTAATKGTLSAATATDADGALQLRVDPSQTATTSTTVVTITHNSSVVATKTLTFFGEAAKIVVGKVASGRTGTADTGYVLYTYQDSAGNTVPDSAAAFVAASASTRITTGTSIKAPTASAASTSSASLADAQEALIGSVTTNGVMAYTCGSSSGTQSFTITLASTVVNGNTLTATVPGVCAGGLATYTVSTDKASYAVGEIATITIDAKDSSGNAVSDNTVIAAGSVSVGGGSLTATIAGTEVFTAGKRTLQAQMTTAGKFNTVVALAGSVTSTATTGYAVTDGATSNSDVLKAIVSLIASINKQIAALQKALLRR
jgi:trimeric autotransporter adhesin